MEHRSRNGSANICGNWSRINEISEEERSSYIGIYRLIAQVEKGDGAALGFLMNQGSDVTMRNLLRAVTFQKKE